MAQMTGISSGAVTDLGLGSNLAQQVKGETEDERKKRLMGLSTASPAVQSLFGISGGVGASGGRGF